MVSSGIVTFYLESVRQAWEFALESGAGVGLILILRWYWWRVSALSEVAALVSAAIGFLGLRMLTDIPFPDSLLYLVPWTTAWWLLVTMLTPPEPMPHLVAFYRRVRPGGPGWRRVALAAADTTETLIPLRLLACDWAAGCVLVYGVLFGIGGILFNTPVQAGVPLLAAALSGVWLVSRGLSR